MPKPCSSFPQHVPDLQSLRCQSPQQRPFSHGFEWSLSHSSVCLYVPPSPLELHVCTLRHQAPALCWARVPGSTWGEALGLPNSTLDQNCFRALCPLVMTLVSFLDRAHSAPVGGAACWNVCLSGQLWQRRGWLLPDSLWLAR